MYLPTLSDEELLRYADFISDPLTTSELERELAKRFREALEEAASWLEEEISRLEEEIVQFKERLEDTRTALHGGRVA